MLIIQYYIIVYNCSMKKLIETTICARANNSLWNSANCIESSPQTHKNNKISTAFYLPIKEDHHQEDKTNKENNYPCNKKSQNFIQNEYEKCSQNKSASILKDKNNSQQVSCLYSQHIYKSMQRDYIHEAQLEKFRLMLDNQKKEKKKLSAELLELKQEKSRLLEQKQIILFALDSLTVKLDSQPTSKKNKQLRRQTTQALKSKLYSHEKLAMFNKAIHEQKYSTFKPDTDTSQSNTSEMQNMNQQNQANPNWQKIKIIRNLKQRLNIENSSQIKNILYSHEKAEMKIFAVEQECKKLKEKNIQQETQINLITQQKMEKQKQIEKQKLSIIETTNKLVQTTHQLRQCEQKLRNSEQRAKQLEQAKKILELDNDKLNIRVNELVKELKYTQQEYQSRQQKEKQCVKILQRFSKQLKLSDEKIQEFLNTQITNYSSQFPGDLTRSKKTYQQHLSYILHLCKKKQALYEHLVQQFKQRMKQSDFRANILQKKLFNFSTYQESLRELVHNQSDKMTIFRTILRFGH